MKTFARVIALASLMIAALAQSARDANAQSLQPIPYSYLSAATTNCNLINASGQDILKWIIAANTTSTIYYLKVYNTNTAPVAGTGTPVLRIPLAANTTGGGLSAVSLDDTKFTQGIGFCLTGGIADTDTTAAVTGIALNFGYLWQ